MVLWPFVPAAKPEDGPTGWFSISLRLGQVALGIELFRVTIDTIVKSHGTELSELRLVLVVRQGYSLSIGQDDCAFRNIHAIVEVVL
jgi:hypothetical protein